jgi:hypothetical protein
MSNQDARAANDQRGRAQGKGPDVWLAESVRGVRKPAKSPVGEDVEMDGDLEGHPEEGGTDCVSVRLVTRDRPGSFPVAPPLPFVRELEIVIEEGRAQVDVIARRIAAEAGPAPGRDRIGPGEDEEQPRHRRCPAWSAGGE